jgi:hypothetical protein
MFLSGMDAGHPKAGGRLMHGYGHFHGCVGIIKTDFSEILAYAQKLRLAGIEKESALRQTLAYAGKLRRKTQNS